MTESCAGKESDPCPKAVDKLSQDMWYSHLKAGGYQTSTLSVQNLIYRPLPIPIDTLDPFPDVEKWA